MTFAVQQAEKYIAKTNMSWIMVIRECDAMNFYCPQTVRQQKQYFCKIYFQLTEAFRGQVIKDLYQNREVSRN